ncbi:hypothetical protein T01_4753 [Trichinella spiralis]|uniref:Uncharacterized protein n=1 Tax=Trichinella spiralis TaxID=6334 RepID=A0A0V1AM46_TRISP|nr:hypothetical protein T01_4753 [Trichinella spiralis]
MTRLVRPACLIDPYINRTLTLKTSSPSSPPRTSISGPNSVIHPPFLPSHPSEPQMPQNRMSCLVKSCAVKPYFTSRKLIIE